MVCAAPAPLKLIVLVPQVKVPPAPKFPPTLIVAAPVQVN